MLAQMALSRRTVLLLSTFLFRVTFAGTRCSHLCGHQVQCDRFLETWTFLAPLSLLLLLLIVALKAGCCVSLMHKREVVILHPCR